MGCLARAQIVLICGWQDTPFMLELLRELDRGTGALPKVRLVVKRDALNSDLYHLPGATWGARVRLQAAGLG